MWLLWLVIVGLMFGCFDFSKSDDNSESNDETDVDTDTENDTDTDTDTDFDTVEDTGADGNDNSTFASVTGNISVTFEGDQSD